MEDKEALDTLRTIRDRALEDVEGIKLRLKRLQSDWDQGDTAEDTHAALVNSQRRLEIRSAEAEALTLAVANFNAAPPSKEAKLGLTEVHRDGSDVTLKFFNHDDQMLLKVKESAVRIQSFAIRVLSQTSYTFEDVQHRLDGLDK